MSTVESESSGEPMEMDESKSSEKADASLNSQSGEDNFKMPLVISRPPGKKSTLHKYLQQKQLSENPETSPGPENHSEEEAVKKPVAPPPPIPYEEPSWKGVCDKKYILEEIKSGVIEKRINIKNKSFITFGRIDICDIPMAHPTVSRYHAVLQFRGVPEGEDDVGFYLYDLKSTHGTFLNKYKIKPNVYARVKVGHMIKIGCSSRFFILQGPPEDEEEESELTVTEMKMKRQAELDERKRLEEQERLEEEMEKERQERLLEERGISWGMGEDADEETDLSENPYAVLTNEELYIDDPKKALRMWFEREGEELHYDIERAERGMVACKLVLPVDDGEGREIAIETSGRNKKEAQVQCALEACRTIDKLGLLRTAKQESKKKQKRNWEENDYYDSDEDSFFDRTGDLEKKRQKRMKNAGKIQDTVETFESLNIKYAAVVEKLEAAELRLKTLTSRIFDAKEKPSEDVDDLDAYMATLQQVAPSKMDVKLAKLDVANLKEEEEHLKKLIRVVKPAHVPDYLLKPPTRTNSLEVKADSKPPVDVVEPSPVPEEKTAKPIETVKPPDPSEHNPKKIIGPTIPPNVGKKIKAKKVPKAVDKEKTIEYQEDEFVDLIWKPPPGQTGDGRTSLNDKLGY